ncbi:MAG: Hpt domain-containing protein [Magnetococcales bacterium]|nr:Hpt domain-containing protein [Magnetococcales bacterium]
MEPAVETNTRLVVKVDQDLEDIAPGYLENRRKDVGLLSTALEQNDFNTVKMIGHRMKGSGAGYGFDFISETGSRIEQAAIARNTPIIRDCMDQLTDYLDSIEVIYV